MSTSQKDYFPTLNGLRAIAIALVLLTHSINYLHPSLSNLRLVISTGWNGVFLFFVLSGFLVGSLAFKEIKESGQIDVGLFLARRFLRTWPLYFFVLGVNYLRSPIESFEPDIWQYVFFLQNYYHQNFFLPSWSLAVEEQFYLVFPLLLFTLISYGRLQWVKWVLLLTILGPFAFRSWIWWGENKALFAVMDSIGVGVGLAYLRYFKPQIYQRCLKIPHVLLGLGLMVTYGGFLIESWHGKAASQTCLYGTQAIGFGLILLAALSPRFLLKGFLSHHLLKKLAVISFSVYLTHDRMVYHAGKWVEALSIQGVYFSTLVFLALYLSSALVLGTVTYFVVEKPTLLLRGLWFPAKRKKQCVTEEDSQKWPEPLSESEVSLSRLGSLSD